ncbi:MAG: 4Fe-4S ferredoxin [Planctomycetota bacterium]|nr:MAG: 4Fe-4S ferredoxin [Planctomycetota bacterium]
MTHVWIEDGCISCSLCEDYCPEVFKVEGGEICIITEDAAAFFGAKEEDILMAEKDCPVGVIRVGS